MESEQERTPRRGLGFAYQAIGVLLGVMYATGFYMSLNVEPEAPESLTSLQDTFLDLESSILQVGLGTTLIFALILPILLFLHGRHLKKG